MPLQVRGGATLPVPALEAHAAAAMLLERAHLPESQRDAALELSTVLEHLPLALEIAASRLSRVPLPVLRGMLQRSHLGLGDGPADLPERQRTLAANLEWSWALLSSWERQVLACCTLFPRGVPAEGLAAVVGPPSPASPTPAPCSSTCSTRAW